MTKHQASSWPWSVPLAVQDVPDEGQQFDLAAGEASRAEIARLAGVLEIPRFAAEVSVARHGAGGLRITGRVSATVGQTCVVTLEPMRSEVEETIEVVYLPGSVDAAPDASAPDDEPGKVGDERIEALPADGIVDLGAIATEFLLLGIDPYPRMPGAVFDPPAPQDVSASPFAALAALQKVRNDRGG